MDNKKQAVSTPMVNARKGNSNSLLEGLRRPTPKLSARPSAAAGCIEDELTRLKAAGSAVQRIRLSAQRELELARQMRVQAQRYQKETETKARSQAQILILQARLATQKDIEELIRKASAEIQKLLADIRMIRITAQDELETQRKFAGAARMIRLTAQEELETQRNFTSTARIRALSLAIQGEPEKPEERKEKKKEAVKV